MAQAGGRDQRDSIAASCEKDIQLLTHPSPNFLQRFRAKKIILQPGEYGRGGLREQGREPLLLLLGMTRDGPVDLLCERGESSTGAGGGSHPRNRRAAGDGGVACLSSSGSFSWNRVFWPWPAARWVWARRIGRCARSSPRFRQPAECNRSSRRHLDPRVLLFCFALIASHRTRVRAFPGVAKHAAGPGARAQEPVRPNRARPAPPTGFASRW